MRHPTPHRASKTAADTVEPMMISMFCPLLFFVLSFLVLLVLVLLFLVLLLWLLLLLLLLLSFFPLREHDREFLLSIDAC